MAPNETRAAAGRAEDCGAAAGAGRARTGQARAATRTGLACAAAWAVRPARSGLRGQACAASWAVRPARSGLRGGLVVLAGGLGERVAGTQHPLALGERALEDGERLRQPAGGVVGVGEVAQRGQGVR